MAYVGFDFGTTNSLISVVQGDRVISFLDEHGLPIPSVVCYEGSKTIVGREARNRLGQAGLGVQGNIVRSPKTLLGRESEIVGGSPRNPVDIAYEVIQFVRNQALGSRTVRNIESDKAVVTIPINMVGYRRALLRDAFRKAGMSVVQFVHEPLAALYGYLRSSENWESTLRLYDRQLVLVFDWGGGTLDLTLCKPVDGLLVQIGNDGTDDVGGDLFDDAIKNEIEKRERLKRSIPDHTRVQQEARLRLRHECERAKIDLSQRGMAGIYVPNFFIDLDDNDLDYQLERAELDSIVENLVNKGITRIETLLEAKGYSTASIALCLSTGGMSNMPVIKSRLHELFGPNRVHVSDRSASLISEGAAWIAHDQSRLHLSKNVELLLARNSYMPLLNAGLEMPLEGEIRQQNFCLYCVDPTDGFGKFELVAPHRPGPKVLPNDLRTPLTNLLVKVDEKSAPFHERLSLDISIDENLILVAKAQSLNFGGVAESEVHDLEFALSFPGGKKGWLDAEKIDGNETHGPKHGSGGLAMRSNIAPDVDEKLIPGEVLYKFNPMYFDTRNDPPQIQVEERLYYQLCVLCGRRSNDPLCCCGSRLSH